MERSEVGMSLKNPVTTPGIDPGTVRLVAQRLKHYATPDPSTSSGTYIKFSLQYQNKCIFSVEYFLLYVLIQI
jgi:hypothetical protein